MPVGNIKATPLVASGLVNSDSGMKGSLSVYQSQVLSECRPWTGLKGLFEASQVPAISSKHLWFSECSITGRRQISLPDLAVAAMRFQEFSGVREQRWSRNQGMILASLIKKQ
jgi:hypothetical protein